MRLWGSDLKSFSSRHRHEQTRIEIKVCAIAWCIAALLVWSVVFGVFGYQCIHLWGWVQ